MDISSNLFKEELLTTFIAGKTFRLMVLAPSYTPSASHSFVDEISSHELVDGSYARRTVSVSVSTAGNEARLNFPDTAFTLEGPVDSRYAVLFVEGNDDTDSKIVRVMEHRNDQGDPQTFTTENGDLTIKAPEGSGVIVIKDGT